MSTTPSSLGVVVPAAAAAPPVSSGAVPKEAETAPSLVWPRSAQIASVTLLVTVLGLLSWHVYVMQRRATRPTALESGSLAFRIDLNRADRAQLLQLPG